MTVTEATSAPGLGLPCMGHVLSWTSLNLLLLSPLRFPGQGLPGRQLVGCSFHGGRKLRGGPV